MLESKAKKERIERKWTKGLCGSILACVH